MFFELLSKLILLPYQQNLHKDSLNTAGSKIGQLFQDFPGYKMKIQKVVKIALFSFNSVLLLLFCSCYQIKLKIVVS